MRGLCVCLASLVVCCLEAPAKEPMVADATKPTSSAKAIQHALIRRQTGVYAVYLPPGYDRPEHKDVTYPACILLHGSGRTELDFVPLIDAIGRDQMIYLAPRAPYPSHRSFLEKRRPGWTASLPESPDGQIDPLYLEWIVECLAGVRTRYRTDHDRVIVVGHSQGADVAHRFSLEHPDLVRAYVGFAGDYVAGWKRDSAADILTANGIVPLIIHGERDAVAPVAHSRDLVRYFEQHKVPHEQRIVPKGDHEWSAAVQDAVGAFIRRQHPPHDAPPARR